MSETILWGGLPGLASIETVLGSVSEFNLESSKDGRKLSANERAKIAAVEEGKAEGLRLGTEQGFHVGYKAGELQGREYQMKLADQAVAEFKDDINRLLTEVKAGTEEWFKEAERLLCLKVAALAEAVVQRQLSVAPETIVDIVKGALAPMGQGGKVVLRLNPADHVIVQSRLESLTVALSGFEKVEWVQDESIASGCIVEAEAGIFDATPQVILKRASDSITKEAA